MPCVLCPQVRSEKTPDSQHTVEKRHLESLARTGQLPFQGKRSYASLAQNGNLPFFVREGWRKKMHPVMAGGRNLGDQLLSTGKRYLGSLAKTGGLPFARTEGKRLDSDSVADETDNLLQNILETEFQLKTLKQELLREQEEELENRVLEDETDEDKRNFASLVRSGNLPFNGGKRSVEALARAGYLPGHTRPQESEENPPESNENSEEVLMKRNIAAMAKNGLLGAQRLKEQENLKEYLSQKGVDDVGAEIDELIQELYQEEQGTEKRNIGSLAREFNFPHNGGKRYLGSLVRAGGYRFGGATKKSSDEVEDENLDDKRGVMTLIRNRMNQLKEGKRYLGSVMRNQGSHFGASKKDDFEIEDEAKRNIGAMARTWNLPEKFKYGKRLDTEEGNVEDIDKRYVGALLRHGSLPVGVVAASNGLEEDKRHIGSLASKGSFQIHKKSSRSTGSDDVSYNNTQQVETSNKAKRSLQAANQVQGEPGKRTKRQAFLAPETASEEFPMPVMQNSDLFDYEDLAELLSGEAAPEKRFLGKCGRWHWHETLTS